MPDPVLLDTCAIIWASEGSQMDETALDMISGAHQAHVGVYASPISAWEVGILVKKGRLTHSINVGTWWKKFVTKDGVRELDLNADLPIASTQLPGSSLTDPADQIVSSGARNHDLVVITRDARLLDYAAQGHMRTLYC